MSRYMEELCESLIRVLNRCAQLDRRRLAGYAANIDFWVAEIQHRLMLVDGHRERRKRMVTGTERVYAEDISRAGPENESTVERLVTPNVVDTSTDWGALEQDARALRQNVLGAAKGFVMKCLAEGLINSDQLFQIEDRLNVSLCGSSKCGWEVPRTSTADESQAWSSD